MTTATTEQAQTTKTGKQRRGFASMDIETRRRIASLGGKAAHAAGKAHEWTSEEASAAGKKGGSAKHANRRAPGTPTAQTPGQDVDSAAADTTGQDSAQS